MWRVETVIENRLELRLNEIGSDESNDIFSISPSARNTVSPYFVVVWRAKDKTARKKNPKKKASKATLKN